MRTEYAADFAIVNSGAFRLNQLIPAGPIQAKTLQGIYPFPDTMVLLKMSGSIFKEAVEEAVSRYPAKDGRFPAISGFKLQFDPSKPKYERVTDINPDAQELLNDNEIYTVAVNSYLAKGGDNFTMFLKEEVKRITDDENSLWLIDLMKQFFNRTSKSYEPIPSRELRRAQRLRLFNTDDEDPENESPDGKWIMIRPQVENRIRIFADRPEPQTDEKI